MVTSNRRSIRLSIPIWQYNNLMWRVVDKKETDILTEASRFERAFPAFYREASQVWTVDEDAILAFYRSCENLYGIFSGSVIVGLVYFQQINAAHKVVHLDVQRGIDQGILLTSIYQIRDDVFRSGVERIQTWVLRQNRPLQQMLLTVGLRHTGLEMRAGRAHGRTLRWLQMIVRKAN